MRFAEVLDIRNGRNQRQVENENGKYPIYGSGGIMGRADDFLCEAETVVIGRKGSINNPIYVDEPFWNVDTAFGLVAHKDVLLPKYLYYFCVNFDFEKLNTTVTIPSLTKANLLQIEISVPDMDKQRYIVGVLDRICHLIELRQRELRELDQLVKSRFIELFGAINDDVPLSYYIASLNAGKSLAGEEECPNKVLKTGAATYDYFDATQVKNLPLDYEPQEDHRVSAGDVIISRMNTAELVGAAAYVWDVPERVYLPDRLWRAEIKDTANAIFVWQVLIQSSTKESIRRIASGTSGSMKNISKPGLLGIRVVKAPKALQEQFAAFVEQTDKSKLAVQQGLQELEILKKSLMQQYFG